MSNIENKTLTDEDIQEIILEPDPARVMEGLRDTGYDFNTAMADLIDNSIAARATVVKVHINLDPKNNVQVYKLITKNSIEEKIYELQERKATLANNMLDTKAKFINQLSKDEIMNLFE